MAVKIVQVRWADSKHQRMDLVVEGGALVVGVAPGEPLFHYAEALLDAGVLTPLAIDDPAFAGEPPSEPAIL